MRKDCGSTESRKEREKSKYDAKKGNANRGNQKQSNDSTQNDSPLKLRTITIFIIQVASAVVSYRSGGTYSICCQCWILSDRIAQHHTNYPFAIMIFFMPEKRSRRSLFHPLLAQSTLYPTRAKEGLRDSAPRNCQNSMIVPVALDKQTSLVEQNHTFVWFDKCQLIVTLPDIMEFEQ